VVHACNPSYSGGRDHEDLDTKPAQANNWWDPISKRKKNLKKEPVEWIKLWALSSNTSTTKKKRSKCKSKESISGHIHIKMLRKKWGEITWRKYNYKS
jgi:hypothetical protein